MAEALKDQRSPDKAAVLEGLPDHPAVKAILAWNADALTDALFDRGELTLDGDAGNRSVQALAAVQGCGLQLFRRHDRGRLVPV